MRVVAAVNLNIFHAHAERVRMTNIAQMVNVLQAMILTDKEKMLLTPTYHVFDMYKPFRGATHLPVELEAPQHKMGETSAPTLTASAARGSDGRLHIALVNLDPRDAITGNIKMSGATPGKLAGTILTAAAMDAHNTFDKPATVKPAAFNGARVSERSIARRGACEVHRRAERDGQMNYAFRMKLKPGVVDEYKRRHDEIWPELVAAAARGGHLRLLDLPRRGRHCTCSPCSSSSDDNKRDLLPSHPVMRRWWEYMQDLMYTQPDGRPNEWPLTPLFHLD